MERLLLVELAAVDRFHRGVLFPFIHGFARDVGVPVRWLRFGVRAAAQFERREDGIGLDDDHLARLQREVVSFSPTVIVLSSRPSAALLATIEEAAPSAWFGQLGETTTRAASPRQLCKVGEQVREWAALLGVPCPPRPERPFWIEVIPDYGYVPANRAARVMAPLPFVLLGQECAYDRALARNPHFDGVDLSECVRSGGCAFCARPPSGRPWRGDLARVARQQLDAVAATLPDHPGRLSIRLVGEPALRRVEDLARVCRASALPPADLLLDARADELARRQGALAAAADLLDGSGHRLHVALVGVESFSRVELERMNKGATPLENLDAALALLRLEEQYPGSFAFREHGGLSLITFTPWSTLDDLSTTLCLVRDSGLAPICGKLLTSRLRLEPALPLTALARRDGLLLDRYDDPALDTAARNLYGPEVPWRFLDPRLEPVCRILVRLGTDTRLDGDALATRLERTRDLARAVGWDEPDLAAALVDEARRRHGPAAGPGELLDALDASLASAPPRRVASPEVWAAADDPATVAPAFGVELLVAFCREGIKPVAKIEAVGPEQLDAVRAQIDVPGLEVRRRVGSPASYEVFFGLRPEDVEQAVAWNDIADVARDPGREAGALAELGRLLGYPECCVRAFITGETPRERESYTWLQLGRRMALGKPVPPVTNPWAGPLVDQYVPCRLDCPETIRLAEHALRVALALRGPHFASRLERRMRSPWLVLLRGQAAALELIPERTVSERFRFRPGYAISDDWELARAAEADEVLMDEERLVLLRSGRPHLDLTARAFVWWHERPLQPELWTRVLALRALGIPRAGGGPLAPSLDVLRRGLEEALVAISGRGLGFGGLEGWSLLADTSGRLVLTLGHGPEAVDLFVTDARLSDRFLFRIGPLAFSTPTGKPLDTPCRCAVVADFVRHLKAWLEASVMRS